MSYNGGPYGYSGTFGYAPNDGYNPFADANCALILDAAWNVYQERTGASATTASGANGPVGTWRDRRGSINGSAISDARRPTWRATGFNSRPSVEFDGADDFLDFTTALAAAFKAKPLVYAFAAIAPTSSAIASKIVFYASINGGTAGRIALATNEVSATALSGAGRNVDASSPSATATTGGGGFTLNETMVVTLAANYAAGSVAIRKNGTQVASGTGMTPGNTPNTNSTHVCVGSQTSSGAFLGQMQMGALLVTTPATAYTAVEILAIERYLGRLTGEVF